MEKAEEKRCGRPVGYFYGRYVEPDGGHTKTGAGVILCGSWTCPYCRERKAKQIMARALKGRVIDMAKTSGFRERYNYKLLTLTCPGKEFREKYTPDEAARMMAEAWSGMVDRLRKECGFFDFIRVIEAQKDGYPHYHVLMIGPAIAGKWVMRWIECMWQEDYHLGFIRLNVVKDQAGKDGIVQAVKYVLKYLFKEPHIYERTRLYGTSRGAIDPPFESDRVWFNLIMRYTRPGGMSHRALEAVVDGLKRNEHIEWVFRESDDFFEISVPDREYLAELEAVYGREAQTGCTVCGARSH